MMYIFMCECIYVYLYISYVYMYMYVKVCAETLYALVCHRQYARTHKRTH